MKQFKLIACLIAALTLAGCANYGPNQTAGMLVGGAAGGLLGSTVGGGTGRLVATGVGAVGGAMVGGAVGQSMDRQNGYYY
jgi:outer membrane lipoprotein SlyB